MALTRRLRVGDRFGFPASERYPARYPAFTGKVTELSGMGIAWYRDEKTGETSCFIAAFGDGTFNTLAFHLDEEK